MFARLHEALDEYKKLWHPDVEKIEASEPYALVPEQAEAEVKLRWPDEWPYSKRAGVYLVFSRDEDVLYVGTAWVIGERLSDHFRSDAAGACVCPKTYHWSKPFVYLITVAVPEARRFEASCLEEFLIEKFPDSDNTRR